MSKLAEVAYVRIGTEDVQAHAAFAGDVVGLQAVPGADDEAWFRSDIRRRTIVFFDGAPEEGSLGIAYHAFKELDAAVERLRDAEVEVEKADGETCDRLFVRAAFRTRDPSGNRVDLVLGPHHSGRRFFPSRDNGVQEMEGVALCSAVSAEDLRFWSDLMGFDLRDRAGDVAYLGLDDLHHRIALYPSEKRGVLSINFGVEDLDLIMTNKYHAEARQVRIAFGPGREAASGQIFLKLHGPEGILYGLVCETRRINPAWHQPRQFAASQDSLCTWGSHPQGVPEFIIGPNPDRTGPREEVDR